MRSCEIDAQETVTTSAISSYSPTMSTPSTVADGLVLISQSEPDPDRAAAHRRERERRDRDATVLANAATTLPNDFEGWVAVADGRVFISRSMEGLFRDYAAAGVPPGRAVWRYVYPVATA
jgi:hypothetical protein